MPGEDPTKLPTPIEVAAPLPFYLSAECDIHGARLSYRDMQRRIAAAAED